MKTFLLQSRFLSSFFLIANLFFANAAFGQATVTTDKDDYSPGQYVIVTGSGWMAGETVTLHFDETPKPATCLLSHDRTVVADSNGAIYYDQFLIKENHLGVSFVLTATGLTSGLVATRNFTDAGLTDVSVTGTSFCAGSTLIVNFKTVSANLGANGQFTTTADFYAELSNSSGSFASPTIIGSLMNTGGSGDRTINATIPSSTPPGSGYRIRVRSEQPVTNVPENGVDLSINSLPPATPGIITPSVSQCSNSTGNIYSISPVGRASSYAWSVTGTGWAVTAGQGSTAVTITIGSGDGAVLVTATNACGTSGASTTGNITPTAAPSTPGLITQPTNKCASSTGNTFSISPISGATSYAWSVTGTGWSVTAGGTTTSSTITIGSGTGTVSVTAINACGTSVASTTGNITPTAALSTLGVITQPTDKCAGSTGNIFSISTVSGAASYTWSVTGTGWAVTAGETTTSATITIGSGVGTVSVTANNQCGTSAASTTGNINPTTAPATPAAIIGLSSLCTNATGVSYSVAAVGGATSYDWTVPNGAVINSGQGTTSIIVSFASTSGDVSVKANNVCGISNSQVKTIVVNPLPDLFNVEFTGSLCETATINLSGSESGVNYQLLRNSSASGLPLVSGTGSSISFGGFTQTGTYTVVAANTATSCINTMNGNVVLGGGTAPAAYTVTGGGAYCSDGTGVQIGLSSSESGVTYQLYQGTSMIGSPVPGTNGAAISFGLQTAAGTYTVEGTKTSGGCTATMTGNVVVVINTTPEITTNYSTISVNNDAGQCGAIVTYTATSATGMPAPTITYSKASGTLFAIGTTTVTVTATNSCGTVTNTFDITVSDGTAPVLAGVPANANASCDNIPAAASPTATDNCAAAANINIALGTVSTQNADVANAGHYNYTITRTWTATDVAGNSSSQSQVITVSDGTAPVWSTPASNLNTSVYCGNATALAAAQVLAPVANDNCSGNVTLTKTSEGLIGNTYTNHWIAKDVAANESLIFTQIITILAVSIDASASSAPVAINTTATLSAKVTIPGTTTPIPGVTVTFYLDGALKGTSVTDGSGIATVLVSGLPAEVYSVKAVAGNGCSESDAYLAVYDPNGGFVTGGGWINSPAGAYSAGTSLFGKANFGFVAKYKKGSNAVEGNTEFQFKAGNLNFKSDSHNAGTLVISGGKATYRGVGAINGISGFKFLVIAIDGNWNSGISPDRFRIKISSTTGDVIYDNQAGKDENTTDATVLGDNGKGGGSIVIHEVKKTNIKTAEVVEVPTEPITFNVIAYPNPSNQYFNLEMKGGSTEKVDIMVYDVLGRTIKHIESSDGQFIRFGDELPTGAYFAKISQGMNQKTVRLIKQ